MNFHDYKRRADWNFHRAVSVSVGRPVEKEDVKVVTYWVTMLMATMSEWTTWILSFGNKQRPLMCEAVHFSTIPLTLKCDKGKASPWLPAKVRMFDGLSTAGKWLFNGEKRAQEARKTVEIAHWKVVGFGSLVLFRQEMLQKVS